MSNRKSAENRLITLQKEAAKSLRYYFIAEHWGGPLTLKQHRMLIHWACECIYHALPLFDWKIDPRLEHALKTASDWETGKASVGDARSAAFGAIKTANELTDEALKAIACGIGHAVSTAHMADHAFGAADYILKALALSGKPLDAERTWQNNELFLEIKNLVISLREKKSRHWKSHIEKALKQLKKLKGAL